MADKRRTSRSKQAEPRAKAAADRSASESTVRAKREAAAKATSEATRKARPVRPQLAAGADVKPHLGAPSPELIRSESSSSAARSVPCNVTRTRFGRSVCVD
jgi:hypothetical protein